VELILKIFKYIIIFLVALLVLFFLNQILHFAGFLSGIHPLAGQLFLLIAALSVIFFMVYTWYKIKFFPESLEKPAPENAEALENYYHAVIQRLNKNKILQVNGHHPESKDDIFAAIKILDQETEKVILDNASWVFVSTAISQNGKLDGIITLFIQLKMIYRISKIYYQKPRLKELYRLYTNVIVTVFLITQIEEINISEHLEPVVSKFSPAKLLTGIPGVGQSIGLLTNMLFEGAANCFLTLRVGLITKEYCDFINFEDERQIRRNCTREAANYLGKIMSENSVKITKAFGRVVRKFSAKTAKSTSDKIMGIVKKPFLKDEK
jgi:ABC-type multidrug transport system fused ATPase/permease subunit